MPAAGTTHRSRDYGTSTNRLELRMLCAKGSRNRLKTNSFVKISFGEKASFHLSLKKKLQHYFVILAWDLAQCTPSPNQADQFSNVLHTAPYGANEIKTNSLQRQLRVCWY